MVRISNSVVGALNVLTLLPGLVAVGGTIYISVLGADASDCQKFLRTPLLIGGVLVVVVSTLGIVGSLGRINVAMYIYVFVTLLLILGLVLVILFALFVPNKRVGHQIWKRFKVTDFSHWLQRYVMDDYQHWNEIKSCLVDAHVCRNLAVHRGRSNDPLIFRHLSVTQSGCCKPPVYCGFTMENVTFWVVPKTGPAVEDSDCLTWSNRRNQLCYDCKSCKGGVLADTRQQWRPFTIFNSLGVAFLIILYTFGCYAIWNNRSHSHKNRHQTHTPLGP